VAAPGRPFPSGGGNAFVSIVRTGPKARGTAKDPPSWRRDALADELVARANGGRRIDAHPPQWSSAVAIDVGVSGNRDEVLVGARAGRYRPHHVVHV
jgi:hypothetical protein